jgi:pimeloyl-ACP methyl ester carboxylesterase
LDSPCVQVNGLRLYLTDWGRAGQPPLLLLHGLASTRHMFDLIAPPLAEQFHVRALDQRGHGQSDKPDTGYDFATIAADVDALLDQLQIAQTTLIGHSWGAYTTLYYAATRPQRVTRAVLLDGGVIPLAQRWPSWAEAELALSPPVYQGRSLADIRELIRQHWLGPAYRPELEPLALSVFDTRNPEDVQPHLRRAQHMQIVRALWAFDPAVYYPAVSAPTLIVLAAAADPQRRAEQERAAQQALAHLPAGQVVWMEDTSHDIPWHRPAELTAILLDFLRG